MKIQIEHTSVLLLLILQAACTKGDQAQTAGIDEADAQVAGAEASSAPNDSGPSDLVSDTGAQGAGADGSDVPLSPGDAIADTDLASDVSGVEEAEKDSTSSDHPNNKDDAESTDAALADGAAPDLGLADSEPASDPDGAPPDVAGPDASRVDVGPACNRLRISSIAPQEGGASATTTVRLVGTGFDQQARVFVGGIEAKDIKRTDEQNLEAVFLPVDLKSLGAKAVRVQNPDNCTAELPGAFTYQFDEDPIVFVHGFMWTAKDWSDFVNYFKTLGYPDDMLAAIQYKNTVGSNIPNARDELAPFIDAVLARTGRAKVDLLAHSMGGVSTRLYIKQYGGESKVRDYVTIASPHHGDSGACLTTYLGDGSKEQCPAYASQKDSYNGIQWILNGDPNLDDVDETPFGAEDGGDIFYTSIRFTKDLIVTPHDTSCLNQKSAGDCSDPINIEIDYGNDHIGLIHDSQVFKLVEGYIRKHNLSHPR